MRLDLSSLEKAVMSLTKAKDIAEEMLNGDLDSSHLELMRAGVIQNFEFTYELCWKFLQRWLKENQNNYEVALPRTRKDLFRVAAQYGLIQQPEAWFAFGDARNSVAHTYNQDTAEKVYSVALDFVAHARYLLAQLEECND